MGVYTIKIYYLFAVEVSALRLIIYQMLFLKKTVVILIKRLGHFSTDSPSSVNTVLTSRNCSGLETVEQFGWNSFLSLSRSCKVRED